MVDSEGIYEATLRFLDEKPEAQDVLEKVLEVDERKKGWEFDDVPVDSGVFGELVSRDIVEKKGDWYAVSDREAVEAAVEGRDKPRERNVSFEVSLPSIPRTEGIYLGGALLMIVVARAFFFPSVFRKNDIVLPGNDPYYYRYWVEQVGEKAGGFNPGVLADLPNAVANGEPLTVGSLWLLSEVFGSGLVLAFYPIISGVIAGVCVYIVGKKAADDYRVGVMAAGLLAFIPGHSIYTSLGFSDHHAFDLIWFSVTLVALVTLLKSDLSLDDLRKPKFWSLSGGLGIALGLQIISWEASPILIAPLGFYIAAKSVSDLGSDRSPTKANIPVIVSVSIASFIALVAHFGLGWYQTVEVVAFGPVFLTVGMLGVVFAGDVFRRFDLSAGLFSIFEVVGFVVGIIGFQTLFPSFFSRFSSRLDFLLGKTGISETESVFGGPVREVFGVLGFAIGPLLQFGFMFLFGIPVLVWGISKVYSEDRSDWLALSVYGVYFLILISIQRRFTGEFGILLSVFASIGLIYVVSKDGIIDPPQVLNSSGSMASPPDSVIPSRRTVLSVAIGFVLITSFSLFRIPGMMGPVTISGNQHDAVLAIEDYSEERNLNYPENYVLSDWDRNRMFNYFVNGEAKSYSYARANYPNFTKSTSPDEWYEKLKNRGAGFVVTERAGIIGKPSPNITYLMLHERYGSGSVEKNKKGSGHFRAIYISEPVKAFALVPGAEITGRGEPNTRVVVSTTVEVGGEKISYVRKGETKVDGSFSIKVAYPGEYTVKIGEEERRVKVEESDVEKGNSVSINNDG